MKKYLLLALMFLLPACLSDSAATDEDNSVGTIVNKPSMPASNLFPDFDANVPTTALGTQTEESALVKKSVTKSGVVPAEGFVENPGLTIQEIWNGVFLDRGVADTHAVFNHMRQFGQIIAEATADAGITEVKDTVQSVTLSESTTLVQTTSKWKADMQIEESDEDFVRMYLVNTETSQVQATYIVKSNSSGEAETGLFTYVDPTLIATDAKDGKRVVSFAFDFSESNKKLFSTRVDKYNPEQDKYMTYLFLMQCGATGEDCHGEFMEILDAPPTRSFGEASVRFDWNETTGLVCLSQTDYTSGTVSFTSNYQFTGPDTPADEDVVKDSCTLQDSQWSDHVFTTDDLLFRVGDVVDDEVSAKVFFQDGVSLDGWNDLTPATIDSLLQK